MECSKIFQMAPYNDELVDDVLATGTAADEERGQAEDDDGAGPLQAAGEQLQRPRDGGGEESGHGEVGGVCAHRGVCVSSILWEL